jgi:hypothetical protein
LDSPSSLPSPGPSPNPNPGANPNQGFWFQLMLTGEVYPIL